MKDDLQARIEEAVRNPRNVGEMDDADAIGTVGSADCGDMLRMWVKFKEQDGRKVIDRATFREPEIISEGIERVFVNGAVVWRDGASVSNRPGKALRKVANTLR